MPSRLFVQPAHNVNGPVALRGVIGLSEGRDLSFRGAGNGSRFVRALRCRNLGGDRSGRTWKSSLGIKPQAHSAKLLNS